ncbi:hypothetical protein CJP46_19620 [Paenibacillus sp. XY044]|nr:hypothetical protein CJP46_19620 [Paenibacillus sp. XY044]
MGWKVYVPPLRPGSNHLSIPRNPVSTAAESPIPPLQRANLWVFATHPRAKTSGCLQKKQPGQEPGADQPQASSRSNRAERAYYFPHQEMRKATRNKKIEVTGKAAPRGGGNWGGKFTCRL